MPALENRRAYCVIRQIFHELYRHRENFNQQKKPLAALLTMIWMRSDVDFPSPRYSGFRPSKTWFWRWALGGGVAVAALAFINAPVWAFALSLVLWCAMGALWFQSDVIAAVRQSVDAHVKSESGHLEPAFWHNWVSGWYWETDAHHQLRVFRPGPSQPDGLVVDWTELAAYLQQGRPWLSNWTDATGYKSEWDHLAYCLDQHQAWPDTLTLPWPDGLKGLTVSQAGWHCILRGQPRLDALGQFAGFHGVWVPQPPQRIQRAPADAPTLNDAPLTADAIRTREAEQEALRYALSHDLRAPLRVVEGFTRIVKEDYGRVLDRVGQDHLERVLAASVRMNGMIDAILAQAQLAGEPLQRIDIDLTDMARDVGSEMVALVSCASPALVSVADGLRIQADPAMVRRVLENLIGNALKYSAKVASPKIEVGVMPATNPAVFFVKDNGAGFDMQHANKLFGMFQRLHSSKEFPGTGVGLAGVQNIIRRHGGRVWAEASPGEGACFYFTLMDTVEAQQRALRSE